MSVGVRRAGRTFRPCVRTAGAAGASVLSLALVAWAGASMGFSIVDGGSMRPAMDSGDVIVYERTVPSVAAGDIVVFPRPGWPGGVAHRVVAVLPGDLLSTRGDANPVEDRDPVPVSALLGKVVARVPSGAAARLVAGALRGWYTRMPIAHQAMTERRPATPRRPQGPELDD